MIWTETLFLFTYLQPEVKAVTTVKV